MTITHATMIQVQQDLMRPKSALYYASQLQEVSGEFASFIRRNRSDICMFLVSRLK